MISQLRAFGKSASASTSTKPPLLSHATPVHYPSNHIDIADFLAGPPPTPVVARRVDFSSSLPQYAGHTALVLDHVLSPDECRRMLELAEASVPSPQESPWQPAKVSLGPGWEAAAPGYRESDRIIWDHQLVVDRLWERCAAADGLRELLASGPADTGRRGTGRWEFRRFNDRMRFLKYSPGQYFKPHTDAPYYYDRDGAHFQTLYTIQLYLNDARASDPASPLVGGATSFLSRDDKHRVDVDPRAGSVLLFQHRGLRHEGATVKGGVKYTMRTDILYEWVGEKATQV